jgi:hypothetical protein
MRSSPFARPITLLALVVLAIAVGVVLLLGSVGPIVEHFPEHPSARVEGGVGADGPIARHFTLRVAAGPIADAGVRLSLATYQDVRSRWPIAADLGVSVDLQPDDDTLRVTRAPGEAWRVSIDLATPCAGGCVVGATAVVDAISRNTGGAGFLVSADGDGYVGDASTPDLAVAWDDGSTFVEPSNIRIRHTLEDVRIGPGDGSKRWGATLHVEASALEAPLSGLRGRAWANLGFNDVKTGYGDIVRLIVGDAAPIEFDPVYADRFGVSNDWLAQCEPGHACDVPIVLELATPDPAPVGPDMRRPDVYRWWAGVQLLAVDGRTLPDGAVTFGELVPLP